MIYSVVECIGGIQNYVAYTPLYKSMRFVLSTSLLVNLKGRFLPHPTALKKSKITLSEIQKLTFSSSLEETCQHYLRTALKMIFMAKNIILEIIYQYFPENIHKSGRSLPIEFNLNSFLRSTFGYLQYCEASFSDTYVTL